MQFRAARHTHNLNAITQFYVVILNFDILSRFENHDNYNGVFLGKKELPWHIEITQSQEKVNHIFNPDDLWVFYPKTQQEYDAILLNIELHQIEVHQAKNPYWNSNGTLIKDPDGFNIIISPLKIKKHEIS